MNTVRVRFGKMSDRRRATSRLGVMLVTLLDRMLIEWHLRPSDRPYGGKKDPNYISEFLEILVKTGIVSLSDVEQLTLREITMLDLQPYEIKNAALRDVVERKEDEVQEIIRDSINQTLDLIPDNPRQAIGVLGAVQQKLKLTTREWEAVHDAYSEYARRLRKEGKLDYLITRMMIVTAKDPQDIEQFFEADQWSGIPSNWDLNSWGLAASKVSKAIKMRQIPARCFGHYEDDFRRHLRHFLRNCDEFLEDRNESALKNIAKVQTALTSLLDVYRAMENKNLQDWEGILEGAEEQDDTELADLALDKCKKLLERELERLNR